jgi:hypothetical protein
MTAAAIIAAETATWVTIVVAVLGSSAIGAIVGGIAQTSLRGTIERREAMLARLIETADTFQAAMTDALAACDPVFLDDVAVLYGRVGAPQLWTSMNEPSEQTAALLEATRVPAGKARGVLARVQLLFPDDAYCRADLAVTCLDKACGLLAQHYDAQRTVQDAEERRWSLPAGKPPRTAVEALIEHSLNDERMPTKFTVADADSVARWALVLRATADENLRGFEPPSRH